MTFAYHASGQRGGGVAHMVLLVFHGSKDCLSSKQMSQLPYMNRLRLKDVWFLIG